MSVEGPLACPSCATKHDLDERFCRKCGMPLVYVGLAEQNPITESHERARKIRPQYTGGELVRVAGGRNQAEAEMIQGMLLEEGIPSILRRTRGFDVPDFLAGGPRDVLVPEAGAEAALEMLAEAEVIDPAALDDSVRSESPLRLLVWLLVAFVAAAGVVWLLYQAAF